MKIQLSPEGQARLQKLVESGECGDSDGVILEALRALKERDEQARLKAAIDLGGERYERGETIPWTPNDFDRVSR